MNKNPYSLIFGKEPVQYIPRLPQSREIIDAFTSELTTVQIYMITGVRGSGKTVLMSEVSRNISNIGNWVVIEINSSDDILKSLGAKLYSADGIGKFFRSLKINLSIFGISVDVKGEPEIFDIETAVQKQLEILKSHGKKVLITIDEVVSTEYMKKFAGAFQIFVRHDLPVFLLMTGLFENISAIQDEKNLTFLYRAPKIRVKPLNTGAIARNYQKVLGVSEKESLEMANLTCGYPFAFQILGYLCYNHAGSWEDVVFDYRQYLEEYVYEKLWSEMSDGDRRLCYGIANAVSDRIIDIRNALDMDTNQFNPYRKRLINKGIADGSRRGFLRFALPCFSDFVKDQYID